MLGGLGGFDLYYSTIKGDSYGLPTNLGTVINTAADEVSPYYNNGTLYFSSNGHPNMGALTSFMQIGMASTGKASPILASIIILPTTIFSLGSMKAEAMDFGFQSSK